MAATVYICESNGAGGDNTDNVGNLNMGSTDAHDLTAASYPITAGQNGYEKWIRIKLHALGGSTSIGTFKIWLTSAAVLGSDKMYCSATWSSYASKYPYAQPVTTNSTYATYDMDLFFDTEPSTACLGWNNSLTTAIATEGLYSDFFVAQVRVDAGSTTGTTATFNFKYTEVA